MNKTVLEMLAAQAGTAPPPVDGTAASPAWALDELVRRVVEVAQPEAIILFGSAARGEMGPDSDLDLLVIKAGAHRDDTAKAIYRRLIGLGQAVDVVVVTPEDVQRYGHSQALVIEPALREGQVIYGSWPPPTG